ncbi:MAG: tRNA (adenosine(37)-N6)-threonylcarbamoyltransferase complex dimerization subunit type 1 TsaB [Planctomycetes bacterium]|nr:tRNA (adenosine(37)-N6)-threonylcarbamoyltransferase complex dimerization subunit type 1 TsaB [Planctomycetota bacterium]
MKIIAIETSGSNGSIALLKNEQVIKEYRFRKGMVHGKLLIPRLDQALRKARWSAKSLDLIAVDIGPGSYTGLRVGLAAAKSLAYALRAKIIGVSSLDALAENITSQYDHICPVIDARWNQVYTATYQLNKESDRPARGGSLPAGRRGAFGGKGRRYKRMTNYLTIEPTKLLKKLPRNVFIFGDGLVKYKDVFSRPRAQCANAGLRVGTETQWIPRAGKIGKLGYQRFKTGQKDNLFTLAPLYLKPTEAETKFKSK